ncbi:hypothetical protein EIP86_005209 [Pleurotus ostreatoroseus]|nr:hypothetical protein EIP86_005209 [Pleurotus ostreatoroseus]
MSSTRSVYTHAAFPSISSTLSLLEERETEFEKRSGVIVTEDGVQPPPPTAPSSRNSSESTILAHAARRSVSADPLMVSSNGKGSDGVPMRKPRPTLNLTTSKSSLQLQELAELAQIPASPILAAPYTSSPTTITPPITSPTDTPSPRTVRHKGSFASLSPPVSSPLASSSFLLPPIEVEPPSRWSMDSVSRPTQVAEPSSSPKPRKRGRFMSLITRARTGSVSKPQPRSSSMSHDEFGLASPNESSFSHNSTNSTSSLISQGRYSNCPAPPPMATSPSTTSTTSSSSNLPTPADSQCDINADPFCPASPTFLPSSYLPDPSPIYDEVDGRMSPPPEPTLPAPSPSMPTPSLFAPARTQSSIPFLSAALSKTKLRRRKRKLVISCISSADLGHPQSEGRAQLEALRRERDAQKRCESIRKWCESFGPVRRVERKPDGSLHVHWKDWEVADTVCRVNGQVTIKGVGRVSLAWRYVN